MLSFFGWGRFLNFFLVKHLDKDFQVLKCLVLTSWESKVPPQSYPPKEIAGPNSRPY